MNPSLSESDIGRLAVEYLEGWEWDVYQEVKFNGRIHDIVAVKGAVVWIVECKTTRGLAVLAQAEQAKAHGNRVSVCVPRQRATEAGRLFETLCRRMGIGILTTGARWQNGEDVRVVVEAVPPRTARYDAKMMRRALHPGMKTAAGAGSQGGERWSPWRETMRRCELFVAANPGCTTRELVEGVAHHYSSDATARSAIPQWLESSSIPGVRCELDGRRRRFFPIAAPEARKGT